MLHKNVLLASTFHSISDIFAIEDKAANSSTREIFIHRFSRERFKDSCVTTLRVFKKLGNCDIFRAFSIENGSIANSAKWSEREGSSDNEVYTSDSDSNLDQPKGEL
jgi:Icc-related predicted phosphoesterase